MMASTPTVSVVMPVYNAERYLAMAVESVLSQTFADFELILVDDKSTDGSKAVAERYAVSDQRVVVLSRATNGGVTLALNDGCRMARGEFIARMDADDVCLPTRFERQVEHLRAHADLGAVGTAVQLIDGAGARKAIRRYPTNPRLVEWSMFFFNSVVHPSIMMRRSALQSLEMYPNGFPRCEDYALFIQMSRGAGIANLDEVLMLYRAWGGNESITGASEQRRTATRIVQTQLQERWNILASADQVEALRGLSTGNYPTSEVALICCADLLVRMAKAFVAEDTPKEHTGTRLVLQDAGSRMWLLAVLSLRIAPSQFARLVKMACQIQPASITRLARKGLQRLRAAEGL
jgi:glycosyltransferase involved in cell wall biosynthesis